MSYSAPWATPLWAAEVKLRQKLVSQRLLQRVFQRDPRRAGLRATSHRTLPDAGTAGAAILGEPWRGALADRVRPVVAAVLACWLGSGCGSVEQRPPRLDGLRSEQLVGQPFRHVVFANEALRDATTAASPRLHVYIDGDGQPWRGSTISRDPSPRGVLVLRLLQQDAAPALYLGRPCHFLAGADPACTPQVYTFERYGPTTVASMANALQQVVQRRRGGGPVEIALIGYSGGGVLAMLLADHLRGHAELRVRQVVTIAANLDVAAWAAWHGYTPLVGSLDPAQRPPLPREVRQLHLVGGADRTVPPFVTRAGLRAQPWAEVRETAQYDHRCCWLREWPAVLRDLALLR